MLKRSISSTDAAPNANDTARSAMRAARMRRRAAGSILESSTPGSARASGGMMTAQATTGPASPRRAVRPWVLLLGGLPEVRLPLADAALLAACVAQVVKLGATHASTADDGDGADHRAVHGEDALDADAVGDLAHDERFADAAPAAGNADAFKGLQPFLVAFFH